MVENLKDIFYKFEFDEKNFFSQKRMFSRFLSEAKRRCVNITFLKSFPPCIQSPEGLAANTESF